MYRRETPTTRKEQRETPTARKEQRETPTARKAPARSACDVRVAPDPLPRRLSLSPFVANVTLGYDPFVTGAAWVSCMGQPAEW